MVSTVPIEHLTDANKLHDADGKVELFEIHLNPSGRLYLKTDDTVTWQGNTYEGLAIKLDGTSKDAGDEKSRPRLQVANLGGMFAPYVSSGATDRALVVRYRVLRTNVLNDVALYERETWFISRTVKLTQHMIVFELRGCLDGQFFTLPARQIIPPQFPTVRLG